MNKPTNTQELIQYLKAFNNLLVKKVWEEKGVVEFNCTNMVASTIRKENVVNIMFDWEGIGMRVGLAE